METSSLFAILSLALYLIGFIPYVYHTFHGRVIPHPFSWTTWCIFWWINAYILLSASWMNWTLAPMLVRTSALLLGAICGWFLIRKIRISWFDYLFLSMSIIVIFLLIYFGKREAIFAMIFVDFLWLCPTIKKVYQNPESEDALAWFTTSLSLSCLLLSLPILTLENSIFWFYVVGVNLFMALYIRIWTKHRANTWKSRFVYYFSMATSRKTTTKSRWIYILKNIF